MTALQALADAGHAVDGGAPFSWSWRKEDVKKNKGLLAGVCTGTGRCASVMQARNCPRRGRESLMSGQPPHWRMRGRPSRGALIVVGALAVAVAVSGGLLAAGGRGSPAALSSKVTASAKALATSPSSPDPGTASSAPSPASVTRPPASAPPSPSGPWRPVSCPSQLASWRGTGAGGQLQVVVTFLTITSQAAASLDSGLAAGTAPPTAVTALRSAAASLRSAVQAAAKNPIPGCVTGAHQAEVTALADLAGAAAGFGGAVSATGTGDYATARRDIRAAVATSQPGSAQLANAITELTQYGAK